MNKTLRNSLALLLGIVLVLGALPFVSGAAGGKELYRWSASTVDKDTKELFSNQVNNAGAKIRWNENDVMYTDQGKQEIVVHNFLNEAAGLGNKTYGLPRVTDAAGKTVVENLEVDVDSVVSTEGMKALNLSFVYAYKPNGKGNNVANSGMLRVAVSKNGMDWLEETVGLRSAKIIGVGSGTGEPVVYYQIQTENMMNIAGLNTGDHIRSLRVMPDGQGNPAKGVFALSELTVTGYKSKADFEAAVPVQSVAAGTVEIDEAAGRQALVAAAKASSAGTELGVITEAVSMVTQINPSAVEELLNMNGLSVMEGLTTKARDDVKVLFEAMYERHLLDPADGDKILADYEAIRNSADIVRDLNTPHQVFRAYAKAQPGDLLVQVTEEEGSHVYMVTKVEPVYLPDQFNTDPNKSTATYLTLKGEVTSSFFDMFGKKLFVPMVLTDLTQGKAGMTQIDVFAAMADGVNVAVTSDKNISECEITVGGTTVTVKPNAYAMVCSDKALTDAVAALADGKYEMAVAVTSGLAGKQTTMVEFEKKDGKAAVLGTVAPDHSATCQSKAMTDVDKNAWYHEAVDYALAGGIMSGYNATTFGPSDTLSRAMVVQVLYNKEGQPAISGKHAFTDVPADQWFNNAVTWGTQNGVMGGYGDGKFGPNDSVTIEQIAVILWNYSGNPAFSGKADSVGAYSGWAANALAWAVENDILAGVPFTNATENATRAQTAQMLMNYLENN